MSLSSFFRNILVHTLAAVCVIGCTRPSSVLVDLSAMVDPADALPSTGRGSRLGPHTMTSPGTQAAVELIDACPRVAKWVLPADGSVEAIDRFHARCPDGVVVGRVFIAKSIRYVADSDPVASAEDFWGR